MPGDYYYHQLYALHVAVASRSQIMDLGCTGLISMGPKVKNENKMKGEEGETRMKVRGIGNK